MDVDPNDAYTPVTQEGNDDIDLDEEDTLDDEFGDMEQFPSHQLFAQSTQIRLSLLSLIYFQKNYQGRDVIMLSLSKLDYVLAWSISI